MFERFRKNPVVRFLASLKLAVITILLFAILMIWGTLAESVHGSTYAKWQVYFSPLFIIVEALLFISVLFAALVRLPFKKRLSGFYIIHLGLLMILIFSAVTAIYGVDGSIQLLPNEKNNTVFLSEPTMYVLYEKGSFLKEFTGPLPKTVKEKTELGLFLETPTHKIYLDHFLPFAVPQTSWKPHPNPHKKSLNLSLNLQNPNVSQGLQLNDQSLSAATQKLGPLTLLLLKNITPDCLEKALESKASYVFSQNEICHLIEDIEKDKTLGFEFEIVSRTPFVKVSVKTPSAQNYGFYPQISSLPISEQIEVDDFATASLLSLTSLRKTPHVLFLYDQSLVFGKETSWETQKINLFEDIPLPWMGLKLNVSQWIRDRYQHIDWKYKPPYQKDKDTNRFQAALITVVSKRNPNEKQTVWIDDSASKDVFFENEEKLSFILGKKVENLPFAFELQQFKMDTNPGTNDPASYESFVKIHDLDTPETDEAHIYMNHPLKKNKYTFYQASYFALKDKPGFGSILSVNYDPGRFGKYMGSLLLVMGAVLHYYLKSKKKK